MHGLLFREEISKHVVSLTTTTTLASQNFPKKLGKKTSCIKTDGKGTEKRMKKQVNQTVVSLLTVVINGLHTTESNQAL